MFNKNLKLYIKHSKVKGSYNWNSSENKSVYFWVMDNNGGVKDFAIKDKNGKILMTMSGLTETINSNLEKKRKEEEEVLNTVVKCEYCNNTVKIRDAAITWGGVIVFKTTTIKLVFTVLYLRISVARSVELIMKRIVVKGKATAMKNIN